MAKPDVVFIHPSDRYEQYQDLGKELTAIEPPVWVGLLAEYTRRKGYGVEVIDMDAFELSAAQVAEQVAWHDPTLVVIVVYGHHPSASTQNMPATRKVCQAIRDHRPQTPILLVGGHVAALPERTMREEVCDFVCDGEGMTTITSLVDALRVLGIVYSANAEMALSKVPDLWYRSARGIYRSPERAPLLQDLDGEMPGLAWDLLPMDKYRAHNWHCWGESTRAPYASLYSTIGCQFHCKFCCIQAPFRQGEQALGYKATRNSYRYWSPDAVIAQIDKLVTTYGVRHLKFADEMFVLTPNHVEGICDKIIERGYDLNIWAYARIDTVKDRMLDKLIRAGFRWLAFGVESGSERVQADIDKRFETEEIYRTIQKCREAGIYVGANYIFGLPEDDLQTMQETLDMATAINAEYGNFYVTQLYPGSQLYADAVRDGMPVAPSWAGYSQHGYETWPSPTKYVSGPEVLRFRDQAFTAYFTNPTYLAMIERTFGLAAVEHIKRMVAVPLKRKYLGD